MADSRIVAVAGATGFVGRHIVSELLSRGHRVRVQVRSRAKTRGILPRDERLSIVEGTPKDQASALMDGAWACINAVGILRESWGNSFQAAHVETTKFLVNAAKAAGTERFIQVSALGVSDEGTTGYQKSKFEGEQLVRRSGLTWTILRPSLIHGADGEFMKLAKGWAQGAKPPFLFMPYFSRGVLTSHDVPLAAVRYESASIAPVAVEDVAWAAAECLLRGEAAGEIYNLTGPETLTWPELLNAVQDVVPDANTSLQPLGIPSEIAALKAKAAKMIGLGGLLPFDEGMAVMAASDSTASLDKAKQHLDFDPRPFRATLRLYARQIP